MIGYKKVIGRDPITHRNTKPYIIELYIVKNTFIYVGDCNKCRAEQAFFTKVYDFSSGKLIPKEKAKRLKLRSEHDGNFTYIINKIIRPTTPYSMDHRTCDSGIHFFLTKTEAMSW